jgi:hypothetical protein
MNPNAPVPFSQLPSFSEGSSLASPRDSRATAVQWKKNRDVVEYLITAMDGLQKSMRAMSRQKRVRNGGGSLLQPGWHKPANEKYEVDPTFSYDEGSIIHIQSTDPLVTTGVYDAAQLVADPSGATTGLLITSCAGMWVARKDVPAQVTIGGNTFWNLPQWPLPDGATWDGDSTYWLYRGDVAC